MPVITIKMLEGRSVDQKRALVTTFTREMARICGCSEAGIHVVIEEVHADNWGAGGQLCSDNFATTSAKK